MSPIALEVPNSVNNGYDANKANKANASKRLERAAILDRLDLTQVTTTMGTEEVRSIVAPESSPEAQATLTWVPVCKHRDLIPGRGVAALINGYQYALFLTEQGDLFAVDNRDPFCDANVMARGIIGDRNGEPKVASPMLKQTFSLQTGICFEDPQVTITTHQIRSTKTGTIELQVACSDLTVPSSAPLRDPSADPFPTGKPDWGPTRATPPTLD